MKALRWEEKVKPRERYHGFSGFTGRIPPEEEGEMADRFAIPKEAPEYPLLSPQPPLLSLFASCCSSSFVSSAMAPTSNATGQRRTHNSYAAS
jgi:hypothetical protein